MSVGVVQDFRVVFWAPLGLIEQFAVFEVDQLRVDLFPTVIDVGVAVKLLIVGAAVGGGVDVMLVQLEPSPDGGQAASETNITLSTNNPDFVPTYFRLWLPAFSMRFIFDPLLPF